MAESAVSVLLASSLAAVGWLYARLAAIVCLIRDVIRGVGDHDGRLPVGKAVLVTNCDDVDGYGRALIAHLDQCGVLVFAGCTSESAVTQIRQSASPYVRPFILDVTDASSIEQAVQHVKQYLPQSTVLWGVVNIPRTASAAGLPAETHTICDDYRPLFETNLYGMAAVTSSFMPMLIANRGRIVNTGCLTGVVPIPSNIASVASETAIIGWSEALRREKADLGVKVSIVIPGAFYTSDNDIEVVWKQLKNKWMRTPEEIKQHYDINYLEKVGSAAWESSKHLSNDLGQVVKAFEHALFAGRPRRVYHVGAEVRLAAALSCLPRSCQDYLLPFFVWYPRFRR